MLFLNPLLLLLNFWLGWNVTAMMKRHKNDHIQYVWNKSDKVWTRRKTKTKSLGRINHVSPKFGDVYYLRLLLNKVKGPTCYEDIRIVNGTVYESYKDACYALGLLDDDRKSLFVTLITSDSRSRPHHVFKEIYNCLSDDVLHIREQEIGIEKSLLSCGLSLEQIPNMSLPDHKYIQDSCNMLIQDKLTSDPSCLEVEHKQLQKKVYDTIINVVNNKKGSVFFLHGYGGTGKTFVWKTLFVAVISKGEIVINIASSDIAELLLSGGRTMHSRLHIPINLNEDSFCSIYTK
uniref:ATP-dependent DNA helicase n=1 Tax=Lactuca sativa TaxID=4236 RepID=A0A9R1VIF8_LACSA|nr:hypothetical protein LSAT_V11C500296760 [Lactuca sativa]